MADIVKEVQSASKKVVNDTMNFAQKVQAGLFIPNVLHKRLNKQDEKLDQLDKKQDLILSKLSK